MRRHLAIFKKPYLNAILDGSKTIEARLTRTKRQPFGQIDAGDFLYLKQSSGAVCATAVVADMKSYENLDSAEIAKIKKFYNKQINGSQAYWQSKSNSRYALLVWLKDIKKVTPINITKKDQRAWIILTKDLNYGLSY